MDKKSQAGTSADTRCLAVQGLLHLLAPLYPVQSRLLGTSWKCSLTEFVLSISTAFCFKQNIKKGKSDTGKCLLLNVSHLLYQRVFIIINASRMKKKCPFPPSNALFKISPIQGKCFWERVVRAKTENKEVTYLCD